MYITLRVRRMRRHHLAGAAVRRGDFAHWKADSLGESYGGGNAGTTSAHVITTSPRKMDDASSQRLSALTVTIVLPASNSLW